MSVTAASLGGTAMAASVMGDDAKAFVQKEQHLRISVVRRQRPTRGEYDRLARTPILVEDFGPVLGSNPGHDKLELSDQKRARHVTVLACTPSIRALTLSPKGRHHAGMKLSSAKACAKPSDFSQPSLLLPARRRAKT